MVPLSIIQEYATTYPVFAEVVRGCIYELIFFFIVGRHQVMRWLGRLARWSGVNLLSPNRITTYGLQIMFVGFLIFAYVNGMWGVWVSLFGGMMDHLDGQMARAWGRTLMPPTPEYWRREGEKVFAFVLYKDGTLVEEFVGTLKPNQGYWHIEYNFLGGTDLGKVWDPFADKLKTLLPMGWFASRGHISYGDIWWPLPLMPLFSLEIYGTLLRRPFSPLQEGQESKGANVWGKVKAICEWLAVIVAIPAVMHWLWVTYQSEDPTISFAFLLISTILAAVSPLKRKLSNGK